jgi:hypothetical protein
MESHIKSVIDSFNSVSFSTLGSLIGESDAEKVEECVVNLIMDGKLQDVCVDDEYIVNRKKSPVLQNVLDKLSKLDSREQNS